MSNNSNIDWQGYEEITKYIYQTLGNEYGIKIIGHGAGCKRQGTSGVEHQIDVLAEQSDGQLTAIECKYWKKKVNKDTVMKLSSIIEDLSIEKGIIVSKEGFTKDALNFAQHKNIELIQLREAGKEDRNGNQKIEIGVLDIHLKAFRTRPTITCIDFGTVKIADKDEILSMFYATILLPDNRVALLKDYMSTFQDELHQQKLLKTFSKSYEIKGKIIGHRKGDIHFDKMTFTGFLEKTDLSSTRSFNLVDQVWMIMRHIFEQKVFVLSKGGIIFKGTP